MSDPSAPPPNHTELYGRVGIPVSIAIVSAGLGGLATGRISPGVSFLLLGIGSVGLAVMAHLLEWYRFTKLHGLISAITALLVSSAFLSYVIWVTPKEIAEDIEKATAPIREALNAEKRRADSTTQQLATYQKQFPTLQSNLATATTERNNLRKSLEETTSLLNAARAQLGPKSKFLDLDDAKRWNIVATMSVLTKGSPCMAAIASDLGSTPDGRRSIDVFAEVREPLGNSGWSFGQAFKSFFPPGITIIAGAPRGHDRECARSLTDLLKSLNISPVTMIIDENDKDLANCHCIEVVLGKLDRP